MLALPAAAVAALAVVAPVAEAESAAQQPEWVEIWSDNFDGPAGSLPSADNWIIDTGHGYPGGPDNWGTGAIQEYTANPDNLQLDGSGNLTITPRRDGSGNWTSARIETQRKDFKPPSGGVLAIEARISLPNVSGRQALGYWPAFWALGGPYRGNYWNWPAIGEFDILENVNGINQAWGVLHCGVQQGGPCNETEGIGNSTECPGSPCQGNFHTYRFEWDSGADELRWYVDGQQFHTVTRAQIGDQAWNDMTSHEGYFVLLNVAMGGAFPNGVAGEGTPVAETEPGHPMVVDYVKVETS